MNELSGRIAAIEEKLRTDKFWNGELGTDGSEAEGGLLIGKAETLRGIELVD